MSTPKDDLWFDDLPTNVPYDRPTWWERTLHREDTNRKLYGNDSFLMSHYEEYERNFSQEEVDLEYVEGKEYSKWELTQMADKLLRDDTRRELCRRCDEYGDLTGEIESVPQYDQKTKEPLVDEEGDQLYVDFPELVCENGHRWYKGEGKDRGNHGDNPILFEDHLKNRRRREIYTSVGTPDPGIVAGSFNRTHPQGRKVNSKEQRTRHGASFYR